MLVEYGGLYASTILDNILFPIVKSSKGFLPFIDWLPYLSVFKIMDIYPQNTFLGIPYLLDLIIYPFPTCRLGAYQDDCHRFSINLSVYPLLNCNVTVPLDGLPVVVRGRLVTVYDSHVPYLRRTPIVRVIVKTVECSSCHDKKPF